MREGVCSCGQPSLGGGEGSRYRIRATTDFRSGDVSAEDEGTYTCVARKAGGPQHPAPSLFMVRCPWAALVGMGRGAGGGWVEVEKAEKGQSRRYEWVP